MSEQQPSYLDWLDAEFLPLADQDTSFEVRDDSRAMWCVRKIAAAEAMVSERERVMAKEIERLHAWVDAAKREALQTRGRFEGKLHGYLLYLRDTGKLGHKKSWSLPNGSLHFRAVAVDFEVVDAAAFLAWCEERALTDTVVKAQWGEAKKRLLIVDDQVGAAAWAEEINESTGEVTQQKVPGVQVTRAPGETFSVRIDGANVVKDVEPAAKENNR